MINIKIIDRVTNIKIDYYTIDANELPKEIDELKEDSKKYKDCTVYANNKAILIF